MKDQTHPKTQQYVCAQNVVDDIGQGVQNAFKTCEHFLGLDKVQHTNADISPEYIVTVKVAESLAGADFVVRAEEVMKDLKSRAKGFSRMNNLGNSKTWKTLEKKIDKYKFGKKDTQRLDILVASDATSSPPYLVAEAKLGVDNEAGVCEDINRIVKLLAMFEVSGAFADHAIYGAVIFHIMCQGVDTKKITRQSKNLLNGIDNHVANKQKQHKWLKYNFGLLKQYRVVENTRTYIIDHGDEPPEDVKDSFVFMPGLVLFGNADDVDTVRFSKQFKGFLP